MMFARLRRYLAVRALWKAILLVLPQPKKEKVMVNYPNNPPATVAEAKLDKVVTKAITDAPQTVSDQPLAQKVTDAIKADPSMAVVPVKSAWRSKINVAAAGVLALVGAYVGTNGLPTTSEGWWALGAAVGYPILNIVFKTFFTNSVTASSAGK